MKTLTEAWERQLLPLLFADARPRTVEDYGTTLKHWMAHTGNPKITDITSETLGRFRIALMRNMAPRTVNKHVGAVGCLLNKLAPPCGRHRDALGLIPTAPWIRPLRIDEQVKPVPDGATVRRLWLAAESATWPTHPEWPNLAPQWWAASIRLLAFLGLRWSEWLELKWADFSGNALTYRQAKGRRAARVLPVPPHLQSELRAMPKLGPRIFERPGSVKLIRTHWRRLAAIAGDTTITPQSLRRYAGSTMAATYGSWYVKELLGHATVRTAEKSYVRLDQRLMAAVNDVEQRAGRWN